MRFQKVSSRASKSSVSPTTTSRATDHLARVTKRTHKEDRRGESSGILAMRRQGRALDLALAEDREIPGGGVDLADFDGHGVRAPDRSGEPGGA